MSSITDVIFGETLINAFQFTTLQTESAWSDINIPENAKSIHY